MTDWTYGAAKRVIDTRVRINKQIAKARAAVIAVQLQRMRATHP